MSRACPGAVAQRRPGDCEGRRNSHQSTATQTLIGARDGCLGLRIGARATDVVTTRASARMMIQVGKEIDLVDHHQIIDVGKRCARGELQSDERRSAVMPKPDAALVITRPHEESERAAHTTIRPMGTKALIDIAAIGRVTGMVSIRGANTAVALRLGEIAEIGG